MPHTRLPAWIDQWRTLAGSPSRRWGLALGAELAMLNKSWYDCLHTGYSSAVERQSLSEWWGVNSTDDLRFQLQSLFDGGYNALFVDLLSAIDARERFDDADHKIAGRAAYLLEYSAAARKAGHIRAFDLGRVPPLVRFGYTAGYINADEAWQWVARAAVAAQPLFSSWTDFAANYWLGTDFWNAGVSQGKAVTNNHRLTLLRYRESPWVRLPWATPLDGK